jgi:hypothetical protein
MRNSVLALHLVKQDLLQVAKSSSSWGTINVLIVWQGIIKSHIVMTPTRYWKCKAVGHTSDKILGDEALIHHVEECTRRKSDFRVYQCWAFSNDPSRIPQVVVLMMTSFEAEALSYPGSKNQN